ncbi:Secretory immunoglobulin A-binding protein EsiB [Pontiella desulfatans]|uniref:Secretory immunoglobulin A-binding protein EsiB n=1 Tax=Pontiella desulfatans TaxID=2750659 RepID=A0A6C2U9Q8_PONDE|nr:alpha-2-macroglobulin family protein [Pontiella desulfatans]VGO16593.1 Secretory immunoglobulin A-binding protein EsiB [Pontiella desulfatans]
MNRVSGILGAVLLVLAGCRSTELQSLEKRAQRGEAEAQGQLGWRYATGDGVETNLTKAVELYRQAAGQGNANAQFHLGNCYRLGRGVEQDKAKGAEWFLKAAEQGHERAQFNLGNRNRILGNYPEAVRWFHLAAEQGNASAQANLAQCLRMGMGTEMDMEGAFKWNRAAAEQGHARGQYNLGIHYLKGAGVAEDRELAMEWFAKAAGQGDKDARRKLHVMNAEGSDKVKALAPDWNRKINAGSQAMAQYNLALHAHNLKQYEDAARWFRQAAEKESAKAQYYLATYYRDGRGVEKSMEEAVKWYRLAAEQGYAKAQYGLGLRYAKGEGVEKNPKVAAEWILKSAEQGYALAMVAMVYRYEKADGVDEDMDEAMRWYRLAMENGYDRRLKEQKPLVDHAAVFAENAALLQAIPGSSANYVEWMQVAVESKDELKLKEEIDPFLQELVKANPADWKTLHAAAMGYHFAPGSGYKNKALARWKALGLMARAHGAMQGATPAQTKLFHNHYLEIIIAQRDEQPHMLQLKTTDYSEHDVLGYRLGAGLSRRPVFHAVPASHDAAATDGELARWLIAQGAQMIEGQDAAGTSLALFAMLVAGQQLEMPLNMGEPHMDVLAAMADNETAVWVDEEPEVVALPDDYAFIPVFQQLADGGNKKVAAVLASLCQSRCQLERAAGYFEIAGNTNAVRSIRASQGTVKRCPPAAAGVAPEISFSYRNGSAVEVSVFRINAGTNLLERLKAGDVKYSELSLLQGNPDWFRKCGGFDAPGALREVERFTVELDPHPDHRDRRERIAFPPLEAGSYLVRTRIAGGNTAEAQLNVLDTMVYSAKLADSPATNAHTLYLMCDPQTGEPRADAPIHFLRLFGGRHSNRDGDLVDDAYTVKQHLEGRTAENGCHVLEERLLTKKDRDIQVLANLSGGHPFVAESDSSDRRGYTHSKSSAQDTFVATDRPVYRPGDHGHIKLWRGAETNAYPIEISQKRSRMVLPVEPDGSWEADQYGGSQASFEIPDEAPLGDYSVRDETSEHGLSLGTVKVEEYRAPEFEVSIRQLDDGRIEIGADYAYGQPVAGGFAMATIECGSFDPSPWYPEAEFDRLWHAGYWWHGGQFEAEESHRRNSQWFHERVEAQMDETGRLVIDLSEYEGGEKALAGSGMFEVSANVRDAAHKRYRATEYFFNKLQEARLCVHLDKAFYEAGERPVCLLETKEPVDGVELALSRLEGTNRVAVAKQPFADGRVELGALAPGLYEAKAVAEGELDSRPFRFLVRGDMGAGLGGETPIRLVREKGVYHAGGTATVLVQVDQPGRWVYFFERVAGRDTFSLPKVLFMDEASKRIELPLEPGEGGRIQCAVMTVAEGKMHLASCRIPVVEHGRRAGEVELATDRETYRPGETVKLDIRATTTDGTGKPCAVAVTVYNATLDSFSNRWRSIYSALFSPWANAYWSSLSMDLGWPREMGAEVEWWVMQNLAPNRWNRAWLAAESDSMAGGYGGADDLFGDSGGSSVFASLDAASSPEITKPKVSYMIAEEKEAPMSIRSDFRDAVYWNALVETDADGKASVEFALPDSLTEWKIMAWAMHTNFAASGSTSVKCAKDFVLQLNTPRFVVEGDDVEITGSLRNHSTNSLDAAASCAVEGGAAALASDAMKNVGELMPGEERMLGWTLKAEVEGSAMVTVSSVAGNVSDAMARPVPVLPHGMLKRGGRSGVLAGDRHEERVVIEVPEAIEPGSLEFSLNCTPNMLESVATALPYLADYPHGCVEQTLNRFLPSLVVLQTLDRLGLEMEDLSVAMPAGRQAVFERDEIIQRAQAGINKLLEVQHWNGWWSWEIGSGYSDHDPMVSAWVLRGLHRASQVDGLDVEAGDIRKASDRMVAHVKQLMVPPWHQRREETLTQADAFMAVVLAEVDPAAFLKGRDLATAKEVVPRFAPFLKANVAELSLYGKLLLAYALELGGDKAGRDDLLRFIGQYVEHDAGLGTYWLRAENDRWWLWHNDQVEMMAWYLKLLNRMEPQGEKTAGVARWLLINRQHGDHWKSTRDTAICVEALCEFVVNNRSAATDAQYDVLLNGQAQESGLTPGRNELVLETKGDSPLFYDATWSYRTRENPIAAETCDLVSVSRAYHRVDWQSGERIGEPLEADAVLKAGQTLEVVLELEAAQELEYVLVQDFKPSGFECQETESGYRQGKLRHYQELHDERVSSYVSTLPKGTSTITYRIRAEHAGRVGALPATVELMYAPDQAANSNEAKLSVER